MKKLFILLMTFSLFTACNNDKKTKTDSSTTSEKDNRTEDDKAKDKDNTNKSNDDKTNEVKNTTDDKDNTSTSSSWTSFDKSSFTTSCTNSAVQGGMDRTKAQNYCECMQGRLERQYPNPNDAAKIDMNSESMKKMVTDCLY